MELLPEYMAVPREEDDHRFTRSFLASETEDLLQFFHEFGFVVIRDVLSPEECERTLAEVWATLEELAPGLQRDDPASWGLWQARTFGMPPGKSPVVTNQFLRNRQNPKLVRVAQDLMETEDVLVNHDMWCMYRPTRAHLEWQTPPSLHLDLNPWSFVANDRTQWDRVAEGAYGEWHTLRSENNCFVSELGLAVQGVINLYDNEEADGGFQIVPGFHHTFEQWAALLHKNARRRDPEAVSCKMSKAAHRLAQRVPMRAGSVVLWDQRCAHGSSPNASAHPRAAQFVKYFQATHIEKARLQARAASVAAMLAAAGFPADDVTPAGQQVFGFKHLE